MCPNQQTQSTSKPTRRAGDDAAEGHIAVGAPVLCRTDATRRLLESIPDYVRTVYIADNGYTSDRDELYSEAWPWRLDVLDLDYDVGIGACRRAIADAVTEPYLFACDNDMELQQHGTLRALRAILVAHADLGGVAAWLQEGDTIRSGACNLRQTEIDGGTAIKTVQEPPTMYTDPYPHARFGFIPQAALFRTACFETYSWDESIYNSEHIDFFLGHKSADEWAFASSPVAVVTHHQHIDPDYRARRGNNPVDWTSMADKYGIEAAAPGARPDWLTTRERTLPEHAFDVFRRAVPPRVWLPVRRAAGKVGLT